MEDGPYTRTNMGAADRGAPAALTASFHGLPAAHDSSGLFSFEVRFNREFDGLRLRAFRAGALEVTATGWWTRDTIRWCYRRREMVGNRPV